MRLSAFICASVTCLSPNLFAGETDPRSLSEYPLEDLLQMKISVAAEEPATPRDSPAIVTLITAEEIENSGARDLMDVLRMVPGLEFGVDLGGVVGLGVRGNWAHEGKVLMRVDRHEINEPMYTNLAFGNHFSVDQIARIEIIRGPGSARFGGFAELAVIDITTKIGAAQEGLNASYSSGFFAHTYARQNAGASYGHSFQDQDAYVGVSAFRGYGRRSDRDYVDFSGNRYDMEGNSSLDPMNVAAHIRYKNLDTKVMYDDYQTTQRDGADDLVAAGPLPQDFRSFFSSTSYDFKVNDKWTLAPEFKFKYQRPWHDLKAPTGTINYYDADTEVLTPILKASYVHSEAIRLDGGIRYDVQFAAHGPDMVPAFKNGTHSDSYHNVAVFSEASFQSELLNVTPGVRYEYHSSSGSSFVPRVGLTKVFDPFHIKFLFSNAFRTPGVEQINYGSNVTPERTQVFEFETGYKLAAHSMIQLNYFDITIDDPIVYSVAGGVDGYENFDDVGTRGAELEYRLLGKQGYATLSYSYYRTNNRGVSNYEVPGHDEIFLGFPAHKVALNGHLSLLKSLSFNPSMIFTSRRFGYTSQDTFGNHRIHEFGPEFVLNLYLLYRDLFVKGLDLGAGVYDVTGANHDFIQPYDGGHAPLPGPGREFVTKLSYTLD